MAEAVVDTTTGEIIAEAGTIVTEQIANDIQNAAVPYVFVQTEERTVKVLSNMMVDLTSWVDVDPEEVGVAEKVYYPALSAILGQNEDIEDIKEAIRRNISELVPMHITKEDIFASINYNIHLNTVSETAMILTTWATVVSVLSANFFRTSTVSVFPVWNVLFVNV